MDWIDADRRHVWRPFTQIATAPPPLPIVRAEGMYLHTADGRAILDGISSWWVNLHGHAVPRLVRAIEAQAARLEHVIFAGFAHEPAARLAEALARRAPRGLERVFYSDDGSTAVEVALKMAAQSWLQRGEPERTVFVALEQAYHGDTFGAMAAGGIELFREKFQPFLFRVERAPAPCPFRFDRRRNSAACVQHALAALDAVLARNTGRVAAVIVEPMLQGAGGMIVWPREYLGGLRDLCDRHRTLLIADEVLTGFGRTGKLFACEHGPIAPDILCLSKGLTGGFLPLGATLASEEIFASFLGTDRSMAFFHGHSYTANPIACAVALESIALLEESRALDRVTAIEARFADRLTRIARHAAVADVRGIGGVAAIELEPRGTGGYLDDIGPRLAQEFLARDVLLRPLGNVIYLLPPYIISDGEIDRVFDIIEDVLDGISRGENSIRV
jgi:adenosylmethionine-8-amino-7-oxononanoate aminotransferase